MVVHPECPCTRASVAELERVMTRCHNRLYAVVLFAEPHGLAVDSTQTELWKSASAIEGVKCERDPEGVRASLLHAETSGQVFLYDAGGRLEFSGGITAARGHVGDNDGTDAIEAIVDGLRPLTLQTPVFGCSLR